MGRRRAACQGQESKIVEVKPGAEGRREEAQHLSDELNVFV